MSANNDSRREKLPSIHPTAKLYRGTNGGDRKVARRRQFDPDMSCGACFLIGGMSCDLQFRCPHCRDRYYCSSTCRQAMAGNHTDECQNDFENNGYGFALPHEPVKYLKWGDDGDEATARAMGLDPRIHCAMRNCMNIGGAASTNLAWTCPQCNGVRYCSQQCFYSDQEDHQHYCSIISLSKSYVVEKRESEIKGLEGQLADAKSKLAQLMGVTTSDGEGVEEDKKPSAKVTPGHDKKKRTGGPRDDEQAAKQDGGVEIKSESAADRKQAAKPDGATSGATLTSKPPPRKKRATDDEMAKKMKEAEDKWEKATNRPNNIKKFTEDPHFLTWQKKALMNRMKARGEFGGGLQEEYNACVLRLKALKEKTTGVVDLLSSDDDE